MLCRQAMGRFVCWKDGQCRKVGGEEWEGGGEGAKIENNAPIKKCDGKGEWHGDRWGRPRKRRGGRLQAGEGSVSCEICCKGRPPLPAKSGHMMHTPHQKLADRPSGWRLALRSLRSPPRQVPAGERSKHSARVLWLVWSGERTAPVLGRTALENRRGQGPCAASWHRCSLDMLRVVELTGGDCCLTDSHSTLDLFGASTASLALPPQRPHRHPARPRSKSFPPILGSGSHNGQQDRLWMAPMDLQGEGKSPWRLTRSTFCVLH